MMKLIPKCQNPSSPLFPIVANALKTPELKKEEAYEAIRNNIEENLIYHNLNETLPEVTITDLHNSNLPFNDYYKAHANLNLLMRLRVADRPDLNWVPQFMLSVGTAPFDVEGFLPIASALGKTKLAKDIASKISSKKVKLIPQPSTYITPTNGDYRLGESFFLKFYQPNMKADDVDKLVDYFSQQGDNIPAFKILNIDGQLLKKNYEMWSNELKGNKNLSVKDILKELYHMGIPEKPVSFDQDMINNYFRYDVHPRLKDNFIFSGIKLTPDQSDKIATLYRNPLDGVDIMYGYTPLGMDGYSLGANVIRFNPRVPLTDETIAHELHHSVRNRLGQRLQGVDLGKIDNALLSKDSELALYQELMPEYLPNEKKTMLNFPMSDELREEIMPDKEIGATIAGDFRYPLFKQTFARLKNNPNIYSHRLLDDYIKRIPDNEIVDIFEPLSGYSKDITDMRRGLFTGTNFKSDVANDIRRASSIIAGTIPGITTGVSLMRNN